MLPDIVKYLNSQLTGFTSVHGLVEIITQPRTDDSAQKKFPALYTGKDNLQQLTKFDFKTGLVFWLKNRVTNTMQESNRGGKNYIQQDLRPICYVITKRPDKTSIDDFEKYIYQRFVLNNSREIREATNYNRIRGYVTSIETNPETVTKDIFENIELPLRHDLMFVKIEMDITAFYYTECLTNVCL